MIPFKVPDKWADFNATKDEKFIDMVSDSMLQLAFKKLPLVEFWYSSKEDHNCDRSLAKYSFLLQLHYLCNAAFPHMQPKQHTAPAWIQQVWDQSSSIKPDIEETGKNVK